MKEYADKLTLICELITAGYPYEAIHRRKDSLGVFVNNISRPVVEEFYGNLGLNHALYAPIIRDTLTRKPMYVCAFPNDADDVQETTA